MTARVERADGDGQVADGRRLVHQAREVGRDGGHKRLGEVAAALQE